MKPSSFGLSTKPVYLVLISVVLLCCQGKKAQTGQGVASDSLQILQGDDLPDTIMVDHNCVLFLWPDKMEQAKMQATYDENSYNTFVDDMTWYTGKAGESLDSLNIANHITDKDVIVLVKNNRTIIQLEKRKLKGDMVMFHVDKEPVISNAIDYDKEAIKEYFLK